MLNPKKEFVFNLDVWVLADSMTSAQELAEKIRKAILKMDDVTVAEREAVEEL